MVNFRNLDNKNQQEGKSSTTKLKLRGAFVLTLVSILVLQRNNFSHGSFVFTSLLL